MGNILEKISLSAFGAFIGIIIASFFISAEGWVAFKYVIPITLCCLFFAFFSKAIIAIALLFRLLVGFLGYKRVAIIDIIDWYPEEEVNRSWTNFNTTEWKKVIYDAIPNRKKLICKKIKHLFWINSFHAVINPYGGVYYEKDFSKRATMHSILQYIAYGGLLVSVADLPFYYAFDEKTGRSRDAGLPIHNPLDGKSLIIYDEIPFMKYLGLKVKGLNMALMKHDMIIERVAQLDAGVDALCEKILETDINEQTNSKNPKFFAPFVRVKYGRGNAIISMLNLNHNPSQPEYIAKTVVNELDR